jgi:hypothetical protein
MSALMAERREVGEDTTQESLFEALAPPRALVPRRQEGVEAPPAEMGVEAPVVPATEDLGERWEPQRAGTPLAGPTLDDVMSRVWEGLATGLPAACPLCHGEVEPAFGGPLSGRCRSCGTAID